MKLGVRVGAGVGVREKVAVGSGVTVIVEVIVNVGVRVGEGRMNVGKMVIGGLARDLAVGETGVADSRAASEADKAGTVCEIAALGDGNDVGMISVTVPGKLPAFGVLFAVGFCGIGVGKIVPPAVKL